MAYKYSSFHIFCADCSSSYDLKLQNRFPASKSDKYHQTDEIRSGHFKDSGPTSGDLQNVSDEVYTDESCKRKKLFWMSAFTLAYFNQKSIGFLIRRTFNIKTPMVAFTLEWKIHWIFINRNGLHMNCLHIIFSPMRKKIIEIPRILKKISQCEGAQCVSNHGSFNIKSPTD